MKIPEKLEDIIISIIVVLVFSAGIIMAYCAFAYPPETTFLNIPYILPDGISTYQLAVYCLFPILVGGGGIVLGLHGIAKDIIKWINKHNSKNNYDK